MKRMRMLVAGVVASGLWVLTGCVGEPLDVVGVDLPSGAVGVAYSADLAGAADVDVTWRVVDGTLPPGLTLSRTAGTISGTPTTEGTYEFVLRATAGGLPARSGDVAAAIEVYGALTVQIDLPKGRVGSEYDYTPTIAGGVPPYAVSVIGLPGGLTISATTGRITGTPVLDYDGTLVTVTVTDSGDPEQSASDSDVLVVQPLAVTITTDDLSVATVGQVYSMTLTAENGKTPYTWSVDDGVLPVGLRLNQETGVISGTPTAAGSRTFTIQVVDDDSPASTASKTYTLVVNPAP